MEARRLHLTICAHLRSRRPEIERATLARIDSISDRGNATDLTHAQGLRNALSAALDYGLLGVESAGGQPPMIPPLLLAQARFAARSGVSLDVVLRCYLCGYTLLRDYVIDAAQEAGLKGRALKRLLRNQADLFDGLLAAVAEEYGRGEDTRVGTSKQRRFEAVQKLLVGELLDSAALAAELSYDFEGFHLGMVGVGAGVVEAIQAQADSLDCRLLLVPHAEGQAWAWLGSRRRLEPERLRSFAPVTGSDRFILALGEPGQGLAGWRRTHHQASAAFSVASQGGKSVAHYADVALLASILKDDLLLARLREQYLAPLEAMQNGGRVERETLRAYFAAGCSTSAAAAMLEVKRHTVTNRLRRIEKRLGRHPIDCAGEMDVALRLADFHYLASHSSGHGQIGGSPHFHT